MMGDARQDEAGEASNAATLSGCRPDVNLGVYASVTVIDNWCNCNLSPQFEEMPIRRAVQVLVESPDAGAGAVDLVEPPERIPRLRGGRLRASSPRSCRRSATPAGSRCRSPVAGQVAVSVVGESVPAAVNALNAPARACMEGPKRNRL